MSKINLEQINKPIYKVINVITIIIMLAIIIYLIIKWNEIPNQIPKHYNALGKPDAWAGRGSILILPILGVILYTAITVLEQFPTIWNTGVEVTEKNQYRVLTVLKGLIVMTKFSVIIGFSYITFCEIKSENLGSWFLLAFLSLIFVPIFYYLRKIYQIPESEI